MKFTDLDTAVTTVAGFVRTAKSVVGFELKQPVTGLVRDMASLIEAGQNSAAMEKAGEVMSIGRSVLAKFVRFSVVDQVNGDQVKTARFRWQIDALIDENYHEDLTNRLKKLFRELEEAVRVELNGTFDTRVTAYNAMAMAIEDVKIEQAKRDRVRAVRVKAGFDKPKPVRVPKAVVVDETPRRLRPERPRQAP